MSYDASYPQFNLASKYRLSYKDFPFAHSSISDCYCQEQSGECMFLYRLRRFFMPDLHLYFLNVNQAFKWYPKIEKQIIQSASFVNREYQIIASVASNKAWENYMSKIVDIAVKGNRDLLVSICQDEVPKYWIINVDYNIVDSFGQIREISCIQIDVGNASRLGINYIDENGERKNPIIIHSAGIGGIERYLYMLFDKYEECFPLWLKPIQLRMIPVGEKFIPQCLELAERYKNIIRMDIDDRSESVSKRIKMAHEELIPNILVMGEKEFGGENGLGEFEAFVKKVSNEVSGKPFLSVGWPSLVSRQLR